MPTILTDEAAQVLYELGDSPIQKVSLTNVGLSSLATVIRLGSPALVEFVGRK